MPSFEDLKLDADLVEHIERLGFRRPTALQVEAVPVIARGTTVMGVASAGSGKTLAYGLGLAASLDPSATRPSALVLRPSDHVAASTADALSRVIPNRGLSVAVSQPRTAANAHVVVASPSSALAALEHSAIKLDALRALVVDGVSSMFEIGDSEALETLAAQIPKEAQRVLLTGELTREVEDWADRHARRARRLAYLPSEAEPLTDVTVEYWSAPRPLWLPVLTRLLEGMAAKARGRSLIRCRLHDEATDLCARLGVRGIDAGASPSSSVGVSADEEEEAERGTMTVAWGTPPDFEAFRQLARSSDRAIVFLEPQELTHLQRLASLGRVRLTALKTALPVETGRAARLTRDQLREAAADRDLEPYMLLIEPLLDEFTPIQLAAAATALLRERTPATAKKPLPAWTRLYFGVGRRDGVRPADLVGAITGESAVGGDRVGRIEIRDTHSSVEVAASVADQVIKSLATATIRGRPANVRVFRE